MMVFSPQKSEDLKVGTAPSCPASRLARESKVGWQTQLIYISRLAEEVENDWETSLR